MLLTKLKSALKTTTKWWMTSKKKLFMTKQSLLLYSKLNLKRKSHKSEVFPLKKNNILAISRKFYLILMTSQQFIANLNVEQIKTINENIAKYNNNNSNRKLIGSKNWCNSLCIKFTKHLKVFNAEDIFNHGEFVGGTTLILCIYAHFLN